MEKQKPVEIQPEIKKEDMDTRQIPYSEKSVEPEAPEVGEEAAP